MTAIDPPQVRFVKKAGMPLTQECRITFTCWSPAGLASPRPPAGAVAAWNQGPEFGPKRYPILLGTTSLPCVWAGGMFVTRRDTAAV